jgi:uncharacterized repeat protein (TIGR02543 family)
LPSTSTRLPLKTEDKTIGEPQTVEHGKGASAPDVPARTGYTFTGWDKTFTNVTEDLTVTAQYSINTHAVTFSVPDGNGSLTAEVGETAITSGDKVDHFSKVVFTAEPDTGYQVKEWKVNTGCCS